MQKLFFILFFWLLSPGVWAQHEFVVGIKIYLRGTWAHCTGTLLQPKVVLTAGHCLQDMKGGKVLVGEDLKHPKEVRWIQDWIQHPDYLASDMSKSTDLGLIFLEEPVSSVTSFPEVGFYSFLDPVERVGFGQRNEQNLKVVLKPTFFSNFDQYAVTNDKDGVGGDSGGPLLQQRGGKTFIVGTHMGRPQSPKGILLDFSYVQLLASMPILEWIFKESFYFNWVPENPEQKAQQKYFSNSY